MNLFDMFEDKRRIIIVGLAVLLIIVVGLILWWFLQPKAQAPLVNGIPVGTQKAVVSPTIEMASIQPATPERIQEEKSYPLGLKQLAMAFAERYGSYSSDEPIANLSDLEPFMTAAFASQVVGKNQLSEVGSFVGFSTKALTADLTENSPTKAVVLVGTQRTQDFGNSQDSRVFYSKLQLSAVKVGDEWKINGAQWQ